MATQTKLQGQMLDLLRDILQELRLMNEELKAAREVSGNVPAQVEKGQKNNANKS